MRFDASELVDSELSSISEEFWLTKQLIVNLLPGMETDATASYWLLKAEPESRTVKGKDVKVSSLSCSGSAHRNFNGSASTTLRPPRRRLGRASEIMKLETC